MGTGSGSTMITNGNGGGPLAYFSKYGLPGLVIAVLFYFTWLNISKMSSVIEKNTEAWAEVKGVLIQVKDATKETGDEVRRNREERRDDRSDRRIDRVEDGSKRRVR